MKHVNWIVVGLALSTALAAADSPSGPPPGGMRGPPIERLAQDLGLTETQMAQVQQILEAQHAKMESERAQFAASGTRPTREEMQAKHAQMDAELNAQLAGVLTPEQLTKFAALRKRHGPPPGPPPADGGNSDQSQQ